MSKGLFNKYEIRRTDGKDVSEQQFFVLRLDAPGKEGERCREALIHYANSIELEDPDFAGQLFDWCARIRREIV